MSVARTLAAAAVVVSAVCIVLPILVDAQARHKKVQVQNHLRTIVVQENLWHRMDIDGNGVNDFWVADLSGMYRVLRQPANVEAMMIDTTLARADWSPLGGFPPPALPFRAGEQVPGLAAMTHKAPEAKDSYYFAAFISDAAGEKYAHDLDGAGQAYENISSFAFMAFPREYGKETTRAFIVDASGVIWQVDGVTGGFCRGDGSVNARPGTAPVARWPNANPARCGYAPADDDMSEDETEEDEEQEKEEEREQEDKKSVPCPLCAGHIEFANTPEGVIQKLKVALLSHDDELLESCVTNDFRVFSGALTWGEMRIVLLLALVARPTGPAEVENDRATVKIAHQELEASVFFVRERGVWKIDSIDLLSEGKKKVLADRDCVNNLKQLGVYIILWVAKYGEEHKYPGPGMKLITDLFNYPDQKRAIAANAYGLLHCKRSGDKKPTAALVAAEDPACISYECTADQLDDTCSPAKPIVWDKKPFHDGMRNVLMFDGSVHTLTEEEFQRLLNEHEGKK